METTAAHRRTLARRATWLTTLSLASALIGAGAASAEPVPSPLGATVIKTDTAPTGYEVTFRVESDSAHVYLLGDTYFTQPDMLGGLITDFNDFEAQMQSFVEEEEEKEEAETRRRSG